jgi:hypothetical protein
MAMPNSDRLFAFFPKLRRAGDSFRITSPATCEYNCIAWALQADTQRWWWPGEFGYWPDNCPREATMSAFIRTFAAAGFERCSHSRREIGKEKIALYALEDIPTHAARQLPNGRWTSKLGKDMDIEHRLKDIEGPCYGKVALVFRRPKRCT